MWVKPGHWPDWGKLNDLKDLFYLIIRKDYGITQLSASSVQGVQHSGLKFLIVDIIKQIPVALVMFFISGFSLIQKKIKVRLCMYRCN